jgi:N-methylhydantoinase B/oxoprolinase/acetone carboxylase alpha subunit
MATGSSDGDVVQGKGAAGGQHVPLARTFILRGGQKIRVKPHRMADVKKGDILVKLSPGGAGVGDPWLRPPEQVAMDVKNEKVSVEAARLIYGVVVNPASLELDEAATAALRANRPAERFEAAIDEEMLNIVLKPVGQSPQVP